MTFDATILDASQDQLRSAQAKITYLGAQTKPIATVILSAAGFSMPLEHFARVHHTGEPYTNDALPYTTRFDVKPDEFHRVLAAVKPVVVEANSTKGPECLSFAVVRQADNEFPGQEFLIPPTVGKRFYDAIIAALDPTNRSGRRAVEKQLRNIFPQ